MYGSPYQNLKRQLWTCLFNLAQQISYPWVLRGDFNTLLTSTDKLGGQKVGNSYDAIF